MSRLRRSLRASVLDGACHAAMLGFGELYFPAFALSLGASAYQVGLLTTVPMLIGAGAQMVSPVVARRAGDKRVVVVCAALQAATFLPVALIALTGAGGYPALLFLSSSALRALALAGFARGVGTRRGGEHSFQQVFLRVITLRPGDGPGLPPVVVDDERRRWMKR